MEGTKAALISLGCDKNTVDSEIILGILNGAGFVMTPDLALAEVIIINTCGFLQDALEESREEIERAVAFKKSGNCKLVIVTGCAAVRNREEFLSNSDIDGVLGVNEYENIVAVIAGLTCNPIPLLPDESVTRILSTPSHYAYLKIAEGCNSCCSYCVIPAIRGPYRSRSLESLLEEAKYLASLGVKELILVAQNTTLYGKDINQKQELHLLLRELSEIKEIKWIRVLYCYPEDIYDELIKEIAANNKVVKYIDMPVQHASDKILKLMNRRSTNEKLIKLADKLRRDIPDVVLRTTLIAGFPGEDKKDFKELCDFVQALKFDRLGVFAYSREEGTAADKLDGHLPPKTIIARMHRLMEIQQKISKANLAKKVGQTLEVIVGTRIARPPDNNSARPPDNNSRQIYIARSYGEAPDIDGVIFVHSKKSLNTGDFVHVKIKQASEYDLIGELYESAQ